MLIKIIFFSACQTQNQNVEKNGSTGKKWRKKKYSGHRMTYFLADFQFPSLYALFFLAICLTSKFCLFKFGGWKKKKKCTRHYIAWGRWKLITTEWQYKWTQFTIAWYLSPLTRFLLLQSKTMVDYNRDKK